MAITFTNLPLTFYTSVSDVVVVSDLNNNIRGSTDLAKKRTDRRIYMLPFTPLTTDSLCYNYT